MRKFFVLMYALVILLVGVFGCASTMDKAVNSYSEQRGIEIRTFLAKDGSNEKLFQYPVPVGTPDLEAAEWNLLGSTEWGSQDGKVFLVFLSFSRIIEDKGVKAMDVYRLAVVVNGRAKEVTHEAIALAHVLIIKTGEKPLICQWIIKGNQLISADDVALGQHFEKVLKALDGPAC